MVEMGRDERIGGAVEAQDGRVIRIKIGERAELGRLVEVAEHRAAGVLTKGRAIDEYGLGVGLGLVVANQTRASADEREVGHAVHVDDALDRGAVLEIVSNIKLDVVVKLRGIAQNAQHGGHVATRRGTSCDDAIRVDVVRIRMGTQPSDTRLGILERTGIGRCGNDANLGNGNDIATLGIAQIPHRVCVRGAEATACGNVEYRSRTIIPALGGLKNGHTEVLVDALLANCLVTDLGSLVNGPVIGIGSDILGASRCVRKASGDPRPYRPRCPWPDQQSARQW